MFNFLWFPLFSQCQWYNYIDRCPLYTSGTQPPLVLYEDGQIYNYTWTMEKSHCAILLELCRICGQRCLTTHERRIRKRQPKVVKSFCGDIHTFYGIDTGNDAKYCHPDKLCNICYRRLINSKIDGRPENKNPQTYREQALKTNELWKPHESRTCAVCMLYQFQKTAPTRQTFLRFMEQMKIRGNWFVFGKGVFIYCRRRGWVECRGVYENYLGWEWGCMKNFAA